MGMFMKLLLLLLVTRINSTLVTRLSSFDIMKCSYGERGSLTATCVNASATFFKNTPYRFDHLDETLRCINCSLQTLDAGIFDISGNQIKILDLADSSIDTVKPRAFAGLIFLEQLILSKNNIQSIDNGTFMNVKKIWNINLDKNSLKVLRENGFVELINLKQLTLRKNQIESIELRAFNGLEKLRILVLSDNKISNVQGKFDNLPALKVLFLSNNNISVLTGKDFNNLTSLLGFQLSHNFIKRIPASEFVGLNNLIRLDLSYNLIDKLILGSFEGLMTLEDLVINHNNIPEIPQKTLQNLHGLHLLEIAHNKISVFQTGLYSGLPQLRTLNVSHNIIEKIEITGLFPLHSVHSLDLSFNNITDVDYVEIIRRLPRLSYLNLKSNQLSCDLEREMQDYFAQDNFQFELFGNVVNGEKCVGNPAGNGTKRKSVNDKLAIEESGSYYSNRSSSGTWLIVLICITLVLVGVLYYMQFRIYKEIRSNNLVSS